MNMRHYLSSLDFLRTAVITPFLVFGEAKVSILSLIIAAVIIYVGFTASRMLRRLVLLRFKDREVFSRGPGYAVMRITHYLIVVTAVMVALQTMGFQLTSVTVIGGFLGVGLGFGLKNVTENFVSGLILLLEQPVRVGDKVSIQEHIGTVTNIGIRSTVVETFDNITLILPNSLLVQEHVINWSHGDPKIRLHVPFGVAYGSDIPRLRKVAVETARGVDRVLPRPEPELRFLGFGDSSLDFDLLVWIDEAAWQFVVKSDLYYALESALRKNGIEIPFPQRDLHVKSAPGSAVIGAK
ncbi:MAG: mechanosensitive ion channel domain-containing protein [Elusimicrobiota bacterium]